MSEEIHLSTHDDDAVRLPYPIRASLSLTIRGREEEKTRVGPGKAGDTGDSLSARYETVVGPRS